MCYRWASQWGQFIFDINRFLARYPYIDWQWLPLEAQWGWLQERSWTSDDHSKARFLLWRCPPWRHSLCKIGAAGCWPFPSREWGIWPKRKDYSEELWGKKCIHCLCQSPNDWRSGGPMSETPNLQIYSGIFTYSTHTSASPHRQAMGYLDWNTRIPPHLQVHTLKRLVLHCWTIWPGGDVLLHLIIDGVDWRWRMQFWASLYGALLPFR